MKSKTMTPEELDSLLANQKACADQAPVTTRATFKIQELEKLIADLRNMLPQGYEDDDLTHSVCITFVCEKIGAPDVLYSSFHRENLSMYATPKPANTYSQLVPIIMGCVCKLDEYKIAKSFAPSMSDGRIPYVRPGGEGTGLIPPPPKTK